MSKKRVGDYELVKKLGSGSFATVFKAQHCKYADKVVAVKAISTSKLNAKLQENLETEIGILDKLSHPNIVRLYGIHKSPHHIYLFMEYCNGGDLHRFIRKNRRLSEETSRQFMSQITKGMSYLWSKNLIHRDLKPQNILLTIRGNTAALKIADFGFARHLAVAAMAETLCGSPLYMAPEILRFHKYDAKADLWSAGTILFEMLTGKPPFQGANPQELLRNIERHELRFPDDIQIGQSGIDLLRQLLRRNPVERISFEDFFASPFLSAAAPSHAHKPQTHPDAFKDAETDTEASRSDAGTSHTASSGVSSVVKSASTAASAVQVNVETHPGQTHSHLHAREVAEETWEIVSSQVTEVPPRPPQQPPAASSDAPKQKAALLHVLRYATGLGDLGRALGEAAVALKEDSSKLLKVESLVDGNSEASRGEKEIEEKRSVSFAMLSKAVDIVEYAILAAESVFFAGGSTREAADAICSDLQVVLRDTRGIRRAYYNGVKPMDASTMNGMLLKAAFALSKLGTNAEADLEVSSKETATDGGSTRQQALESYKQGLTVIQSLAAEPDLSADDAKLLRAYIAMLMLRIESLSAEI